MTRYLVIKNANVKVSYNDAEYLPEGGELRVFMDAAADTNTATLFTVTNTSAAEIEITVTFEAVEYPETNRSRAYVSSVYIDKGI